MLKVWEPRLRSLVLLGERSGGDVKAVSAPHQPSVSGRADLTGSTRLPTRIYLKVGSVCVGEGVDAPRMEADTSFACYPEIDERFFCDWIEF
jgi:hypothetical protein